MQASQRQKLTMIQMYLLFCISKSTCYTCLSALVYHNPSGHSCITLVRSIMEPYQEQKLAGVPLLLFRKGAKMSNAYYLSFLQLQGRTQFMPTCRFQCHSRLDSCRKTLGRLAHQIHAHFAKFSPSPNKKISMDAIYDQRNSQILM